MTPYNLYGKRLNTREGGLYHACATNHIPDCREASPQQGVPLLVRYVTIIKEEWVDETLMFLNVERYLRNKLSESVTGA